MLGAPSAGTSTVLAVLVTLVLLPACGFTGTVQPTPPPVDGGVGATNFGHVCGTTANPPMPHALIGPDVDVRVFCAESTVAAIASVDELGTGVTRWSFTVTGDTAFGPGPASVQVRADAGAEPLVVAGPITNMFETCQANSPQVAFVQFIPPIDAVPGSTFDAIATVHADDGSFADGTVRLHGEVVAPVVTLDKFVSPSITVNETSIDFGALTQGFGQLTVDPTFRIKNGAGVVILPDSFGGPFFSLTAAAQNQGSSVQTWAVTFLVDSPGDYSDSVVWTATPNGSSPLLTACNWTTTMMLHARVVGDGGADADSADAIDGGVDQPQDGP